MSSRALSLLPMPLSPRMSVPWPKIFRRPAEIVVCSAPAAGRPEGASGTDLFLLGPEGLDDVRRRRRLEQLRGERPGPPDEAGDRGQEPQPGAGIVLGRDEKEEDVGRLAVDRLEDDAFQREAEQQGRRLEPLGPAVRHGDALADGRRAHLLPLQELVEEGAVEPGGMPGLEGVRHLAEDAGPVSGREARQDQAFVEERVDLDHPRRPVLRARRARTGRPCDGRPPPIPRSLRAGTGRPPWPWRRAGPGPLRATWA